MEELKHLNGILATSLDNFLSILSAYSSSLLVAFVLVISGIIIAWLCRWIILRLCIGMDKAAHKFAFKYSGIHFSWSVIRILAGVAYWLILLFFFAAAAESLGFPGLSDWIGKFIVFLPSLLVAVFIIWLGYFLGTVASNKVIEVASANELAHAKGLGAASRLVVIILTTVIGLSQIGIHIQVIEHLLVVAVAAIFVSLALAFGLGAGPAMTNIIAVSNLKQRYSTGDHVKIEQIEGTIISFTKTAVIIDNGSQEIMVPARLFQENASFLFTTDVGNDSAQ